MELKPLDRLLQILVLLPDNSYKLVGNGDQTTFILYPPKDQGCYQWSIVTKYDNITGEIIR